MNVFVDRHPDAITQLVFHLWGQQWPDDLPLTEHEVTRVTPRSTACKTTDLDADTVLMVEGPEGPACLIQLEFQGRPDPLMPLRSLESCTRAMKKYWNVYGDLPIIAAVISMFDDKGHLPLPLLRWKTPNGRTMMWFSYLSISLPALSREELQALHRPELWPLILLTKEPIDRRIVREMLTNLVEQHLHDVVSLGHAAASWRLTGDDQKWLYQEYQKMLELFRETPVFQWMQEDATKLATARVTEKVTEKVTKEVTEKVTKEVTEKVMKEQARLRKLEQRTMLLELRQTVTELVTQRFSELTRLAQIVARTLTRPESFGYALLRFSQARDAAEAQEALMAASDEEAGVESLDLPA
jgi:hypothetical protein